MKVIKILSSICLALAFLNSAFADPEDAEERAYQLAVKFKDRGFYILPVEAGMLQRGETYRLTIPIVRGMDYLVIAAGDFAGTDVDVYVYSEVGSLVIDDRRSYQDGLVQFRAQYTGEVYAYIFMAKSNPRHGLPHWAAFVGRRGNSFSEGGTPLTDEEQPMVGKPAPDSVKTELQK